MSKMTVVSNAEVKQALRQLGKRNYTGRYRRRLARDLKEIKKFGQTIRDLKGVEEFDQAISENYG
jgi:hypothetical protein